MNTYKVLNAIVWLLFLAGLTLLIYEPFGQNETYLSVYLTCLKLYLLGISAFLVFKRVAYYRLRGKVDTIRLSTASPHRMNFLWQGILLAVIYLAIVALYGELKSFSTVLILIVLFYYVSQVIQNGTPSIYINEKGLTYDDYFVNVWNWQQLQRIELSGAKLRLVNPVKDFELDFSTIDEVNFKDLSDEVESAVLDGEFAKSTTSQNLVEIVSNYANVYGLQLVNQRQRKQ